MTIPEGPSPDCIPLLSDSTAMVSFNQKDTSDDAVAEHPRPRRQSGAARLLRNLKGQPDEMETAFAVNPRPFESSSESIPLGGDAKVGHDGDTVEGGLERFYVPIAAYEGRHRYDPKARWTETEEKALVRRLDVRICAWCCFMFFALQLDRANITQALSDNFLEDLGLTTNDYNYGQTIFFVSFLSAELPSQLVSKKIGPDNWIPIQMICWSVVTCAQSHINGRATFTSLALYCKEQLKHAPLHRIANASQGPSRRRLHSGCHPVLELFLQEQGAPCAVELLLGRVRHDFHHLGVSGIWHSALARHKWLDRLAVVVRSRGRSHGSDRGCFFVSLGISETAER